MDTFNNLEEVIINRRSTKPAVMNGNKIDDVQVKQILALANWAPTHGLTEPWRFIVYKDEAAKRFCSDQADMYKANTPADKFMAVKYEKLLHNGDKASHFVVAYMKRGNNPSITALEEICATAAAVQNILLGAETLGIAALWSTGGAILKPGMNDYLNLGSEDVIIGLLYLGYTDDPKKPGRRTPVEDKITWAE
jgi:nitroreductase